MPKFYVIQKAKERIVPEIVAPEVVVPVVAGERAGEEQKQQQP